MPSLTVVTIALTIMSLLTQAGHVSLASDRC